MSESSDGASVATTRQNEGKPPYVRATASARGPEEPAAEGGTNPPTATDSARVTVVLGSTTDSRLSHKRGAGPASSDSPGADPLAQAKPMHAPVTMTAVVVSKRFMSRRT